MKNKTLLEKIVEFDKRRVQKNKLFNKKYSKLNLQDKDSFDNIVDRRYGGTPYFVQFLIVIPKIILWCAIFGFVFNYFLGINIISALILVSIALLNMWFPITIFGFFIDVVNLYRERKYKMKLLK